MYLRGLVLIDAIKRAPPENSAIWDNLFFFNFYMMFYICFVFGKIFLKFDLVSYVEQNMSNDLGML